MIYYSWFSVTPCFNIGRKIEKLNGTNRTYTITDPKYELNATGYYCVANNNEGITVSNTSTLIGNNYCITQIYKGFDFCN